MIRLLMLLLIQRQYNHSYKVTALYVVIML